MRLFHFRKDGRPALGLHARSGAFDVSASPRSVPQTIDALLTASAEQRRVFEEVIAWPTQLPPIDPAKLHLLPPVLRPGKIICLGLNYPAHAREVGASRPEFPVVFLRATSSIVGPRDPIVRPHNSVQLDYEGELAVVIGTRAKRLDVRDAAAVIAGYAVFNDGSIRDYQKKTHQWTLGKNFDGTGAFGPELVSPDELPVGAADLRITTRLNGVLVQEASTNDMIFGVFETVSILSQLMTLEPADLIVMGTPAGVGAARTPPLWMAPGDRCEVEIAGIGLLDNPIAQEAH